MSVQRTACWRRHGERWLGRLVLGALLLSVTTCGESSTEGGVSLPPIFVTATGPAPLLPNAQLLLQGSGFVAGNLATHEVTFTGTVDGEPIPTLRYSGTQLDDGHLSVQLDDALWRSGFEELGLFEATMTIRRFDTAGSFINSRRFPLTILLARSVTPRLDRPEELGGKRYIGDEISLSGDGFVQAAEGLTVLSFRGTLAPGDGTLIAIADLEVPIRVINPWLRTAASFRLTADVFGVRPGRFTGTVRPVNILPSGARFEGPSADVDIDLEPPIITGISPTVATRGQILRIEGRGFAEADGQLEVATVLLFDGEFAPRRGPVEVYSGAEPLVFFPESVRNNAELAVALRVEVTESNQLEGLGARAGTLRGRLRALVLSGEDAIEGPSKEIVLEIGNPLQIVDVRFLPAFDKALWRFGLLAERSAVIDRIFEVLARDYAGLNLRFVGNTPTDNVDFAVVEVAGPDPNGGDLFGLDNTVGKDIGNLRFDDVIGGFNADTRALDYAAYGGIFVEEMLTFSPSLSDRQLSSPRFDDIFAELLPDLGGTPAAAGESARDDARGEQVRLAARVLGNLIGSTIVHEVGHTLGLTAEAGRIHNEGDNPGWIMDAGSLRPFEERAEIDGQGPGVFSPANRTYLESVLPIDGPAHR